MAVDLWVGQLSPKVNEGVADGVIQPDRFNACFNQHPEVMVQIMKLARLGESSEGFGEKELLYRAGVQDFAKTILTLAAVEGKPNAETDQ